ALAREVIPPGAPLSEVESDLATVYAEKLPNLDIRVIGTLRQNIRGTPEYQSARRVAGKDIGIFFPMPEIGTRLFWVKDQYAAGNFDQAGTRIHISLPLAISQAYPGLALQIGRHELDHIAKGNHDSKLDATLASIAEKDSRWRKLGLGRGAMTFGV